MADFTTGLIRRWTMNGIVGTNVPEMVGGNDGTISGSGTSVVLGPPKLGGSALKRTLSGDEVALGAISSDLSATPMVVAYWCKQPAQIVAYAIASRDGTAGHGSISSLHNNANLQGVVGNVVESATSISVVTDDSWAHYVVSIDVADEVSYFVNGAQGTSDTSVSSSARGGDPYKLFQRPGAAATGVMTIADMRVYAGRTFTLADAQALFNFTGYDIARTVKNTISPTVIPTVIPTA